MSNTVRTCARPPQIVRRPRRVPLSQWQRRHADQGRDLLPRERPQLGECQQQRAGTHGPHALGTLQQIVMFPPQRAGPEPRLEVVVQRGDPRIAPRHMGRNILREARARPREAVAAPRSACRSVAGGAPGGRAAPASGRRGAAAALGGSRRQSGRGPGHPTPPFLPAGPWRGRRQRTLPRCRTEHASARRNQVAKSQLAFILGQSLRSPGPSVMPWPLAGQASQTLR